MTQEDSIQKAWDLMSKHNTELLLRVVELEKQIRTQSIWLTLKARFRCFIGKE
jgi:hypothetical protein